MQTPHIRRRTALLTRATALAAALALWPLSSVQSQEPPPADDPTAAPAPVSRPGVLTRPGTPPPAAEPEATEDQEPQTDGQAQAEPGGTPGAPTTPPTAPSQPATGTPPAAPAEATDPNIRSGPRVLEVQEVAPDIGRIDGNFTEPFDPLDPPSNVTVNIDFNQADLSDVVMWMSALTGRNFIIADTISASKKITIISPRPVSINEAYRAFLAALNMNGLTIVPFGRFFKIVESSTAQRQALEPTRSVGQIPNDDRMVTHIHQLQHVSIATVQGVLDALKSDQGQLVPYEPTNTIILTDTGLSIRRLLDVLAMLDVPSGQDRIHIYQVQHAAAEDLRGTLLEIFPPDSGTQQATQTEARPRRTRRAEEEAAAAAAAASSADVSAGSVVISQIIADERTNQLIVLANERSYERILQIIGQLDVPIPGEGQIHVIFLENANAADLASTLQSLTQGIESQREDGGTTRRTARASADAPATAGGTTLSGDVSITADESTNALVIVASLRDFLAIQNVIRQLDRRRQQVYVEAVIMEVTMNRTSGFGVAFNGGALPSIGGEDAPVFGGTVLGDLTSLTLDPSSIMGLAMGIRGPSVPGLGLPSFGAILQAMQTDNDVNVLSTPHILTMDNEEAEIIVGENIPFISGGSGLGGGLDLGSLASLAGAQSGDIGSLLGGLGGGIGGLGGLGGGFQVQRQDVALTLRITPQINESNFVRLEIEEEVEDVQSIDPILGPRTTTRQARTTVVVQDQQTIVIGGLMRDTTVRDVNKVPFLGDIPIIGYLFRNTVNRDVKTNLLLLLTPYIIRDPSDFGEIFRRKMQEREEFIQYFGRTGAEYVRSVDYARKDGPLQTAFETIRAAVDEEDARQRAFSTPTTEAPLATPTDAPIRIRVETPAP